QVNKKTGKMEFRVEVRDGSVIEAGPPGNTESWDDTTFATGNRCLVEIHGPNSHVECGGTGSTVNTHGTGGGDVHTVPGSTENKGTIDGQSVNFTMQGHANDFKYQGGDIKD